MSSATLAFSGSLAESSAPEPAPSTTITATPASATAKPAAWRAPRRSLRTARTAAIAGENVTTSEAIGGDR